MTGSDEHLDLTVKIAKSVDDFGSDQVEVLNLRCEEGQVIKIGRATKSQVPIASAAVSWLHAEMRLLPKAEGGRSLRVGLRDVSSNGTGVQPRNAALERIPKGEDVPVPDGAMVALPMRLKKPEDQRFFTVHFAAGAPAAEDASAEAVDADKEADTKAESMLYEMARVQNIDSDISEDADAPAAPAKARKTAAAVETGDIEEPATKRPRVEEASSAPPAMPPRGPPGVRPPPRGARCKGAAMPPRPGASSEIPAALREQMEECESLIRDARGFEERNQWGQAFDCYQRGLAGFFEVLPKLGKDSPNGISLRQQINSYLTRAGELKEKLERSKTFGCRVASRPRRAPTA